MDSRRKKQLLIAVAILVVLAVLLFGVWWFWNRTAAPSVPTPPAPTGEPTTLPPTTDTPLPATPSLSTGDQNAVRLARLFAERFGTFTSQSDFEGVRELAPLATASFATWIESQYVSDLRTKYPAGTYAGQTTTAMGTTVRSSSETAAEIEVRTQREATTEQSAPVVTNPVLVVSLVKQGDAWFVDAAKWERE